MLNNEKLEEMRIRGYFFNHFPSTNQCEPSGNSSNHIYFNWPFILHVYLNPYPPALREALCFISITLSISKILVE